MSRRELLEELVVEIRRRVFEADGFIKLTQVVRSGGGTFKISLRPMVLRGERVFQGEMTEGGQTRVKNLDRAAAQQGLEEILAQTGPRGLHLITREGDLHVRVTKKGKVLLSRGKSTERKAEAPLAHDRVKSLPLTSFNAVPLLQVLNICDAHGEIKPSMRGKYDQINEFIRAVETTITEVPENQLNLVDCGCGRAYLTLAMHAYLSAVRGWEVRICGIDRNGEIIATARKLAQALDVAEQVTFIEGDIATAELPFEPDALISLHACDTATDAALARGVEWRCRYIFAAPCCQHELHKTLKNGGAMQAVLRHGILRERLADLLTDTFRAQILRILGFRVQVVEFTSFEATARNIMLKAQYAIKPGQRAVLSEYLELRDLWQVQPWLEKRLAPMLAKYLERYDP